MSEFKYNDYSTQVIGMMNDVVTATLEECLGELESQTKRNTAVQTGQLKNSWTHSITSENDVHTGAVGTPLERGIWYELGTGEYALNGNGRKGGWYYEDAEGNGHFTYGMEPRRPLWKAYTNLKNKIINRIQSALKGGLS